jgi:hypothetical protein
MEEEDSWLVSIWANSKAVGRIGHHHEADCREVLLMLPAWPFAVVATSLWVSWMSIVKCLTM